MFSELYKEMRLQNLEQMVGLICDELDAQRYRSFLPALPSFSFWPLVVSVTFKIIMFIGFFLLFIWDEQKVVFSEIQYEVGESPESSKPEETK